MNKKTVMMLLLLGLCIPSFAADKAKRPAHEPMPQKGAPTTIYPCHCEEIVGEIRPIYRRENPVRKEMREKQIPQKLEKLIAQYEQLNGKAQEVKKAEIATEVATVREAQLKDMQDMADHVIASLKYQEENVIPQQEKQLQEMLARTQAEREPAAKQAWVDEKTEALIAADGDVKVLFGKPCNCAKRPAKMMKHQQKRLQATEEKMAKLVKEYKKASTKKQAGKKAKIAEEVAAIHEAQLERNQRFDEFFARRLEKEKSTLKDSLERANQMQQHVKQKQEQKQAWVDEKTEALIKADGDVKVLFGRPERGMKDGKGPHMKGHKGHKFGPKDGKGPRMGENDPRRVGINPPPPPPVEEK